MNAQKKLGLSVADCINDPCLFSMVSNPQKKLPNSRWKDAVLDYTAPAPHQEDLVLAKLGHGGQPAQLAKNFFARLSPINTSKLTYDPIRFGVVPLG